MSKLVPGWHVIYTKPKHEKKVHDRLTGINIKSFLPTVKKLKTWSDRRKYTDTPLFPSYLFIYLDDLGNYFRTLDTDGCLYYIKTGGVPSRISDSVINSIMLSTSNYAEMEVSTQKFEKGNQLVIKQGVLTGVQCEMVEYDQNQKLLIRVDLLNRNILVSVPEEDVMLF